MVYYYSGDIMLALTVGQKMVCSCFVFMCGCVYLEEDMRGFVRVYYSSNRRQVKALCRPVMLCSVFCVGICVYLRVFVYICLCW